MNLANFRKEYTRSGLRRNDLDPDPFRQFESWFQQVLQAQAGEPYAMTLATADRQGHPSARTVLLRHVDPKGFVFYTNYQSRKGRELEENPHAALAFFWPEFERQVCVAGRAVRVSREESEAYFKSRPKGSQLAAWTSQQSQAAPHREALDQGLQRRMEEFGEREIPLPPYWGGYILSPASIEFWQGRPNRLHDRFRYMRQPDGSWAIDRLWP